MSLPGSGGDREALVRAAVAEGKAAGADLVVLPEATLPGYSHARTDASEPARTLAGALARQHDVHVAISFLDGAGCSLGLAGPGTWFTYRKRFPSPAESRGWAAGTQPGIVDTPIGRVGLAICADVLQLQVWREFRAENVDVVLIAGAWPAYTTRPPPGLGWLWRGSNDYRDDLLARASDSLGAPIAFANASGPTPNGHLLAGGAAVWSAGTRVRDDRIALAQGSRRPAGQPLRHRGPWRIFCPVYGTIRLPRLQRD